MGSIRRNPSRVQCIVRVHRSAILRQASEYHGYLADVDRAVNMTEISAEALIDHGEDEEIEWEDWPFCVDDIVVERLDGLDEWERPDLGWPGGIPLLPPLARRSSLMIKLEGSAWGAQSVQRGWESRFRLLESKRG